MSPWGACRAGDTLVWTCVLLRPIVARVIKIFEPMNIPDPRGGDIARRLSPVVDEYREWHGVFATWSFVTVLRFILFPTVRSRV